MTVIPSVTMPARSAHLILVPITCLIALGNAAQARADDSTPPAQERGVPVVEAGLKAGASRASSCDDCANIGAGPHLAAEVLRPLGRFVAVGIAADYSTILLGGKDDFILVVGALLRALPVQVGPIVGYVDVAFGASNRAIGAFAGAGVDYQVTRHFRVGPWARIIWPGATEVSCSGSGGGSGSCKEDPPYPHAVAYGLGLTANAF